MDENDVRRGIADKGSRGGAFSLITLVAQKLDACFLLGEVFQKFKRAVCRMVVRRDQLSHARLIQKPRATQFPACRVR